MFSNNKKEYRQRLQLKTAAFFAIACGILFACGASDLHGQSFTENFDVVPVPGWTTQNNSTTIGTTGWYQGNTTRFPAQSGAANSYVAVDTNSTTGTNTISNWMISPQRTFSNGDVIKFYTRSVNFNFPDRLQVRLSQAGASTNVGTGPTAVGDFTTLLRDINPTYTASGYPTTWTEFTIVISGLSAPTPGRLAFRYFVENGGPTGSRSNYIGIDNFRYTAAADIVPGQHVSDYDGDGKTDFAVVRNTGGGANGQITWFINLNGSSTTYASAWGLTTDAFVPEDYDGDGKTDIAVWRGGAPTVAAFYILQSQSNTLRIDTFGQSGDDASVVGDYDGDGQADVAVYRGGVNSGEQSTWFYRGSLNNPSGSVTYVPWGKNGDFPGPGDYDGDGKNDFVVQRTEQVPFTFAQFWMLQTTAGIKTQRFGNPTDQVAPGDYDGDGKTDLAVIRSFSGSLRWYYLSSQNGSIIFSDFGVSATDFPTPGDYDGDGKSDLAIWRPSATAGASTFWVQGSTFGPFSVPFGAQNDYPPANMNVH